MMNRAETICLEVLKNKKIRDVYIYPYGNIGYEVRQILTGKYEFDGQVICIDNYLSKVIEKIAGKEALQTVDWKKGESVLILASDRYDIYYELRGLVDEFVPKQYVLDYCPINPLCFFEDPRVAALAIQASEIRNNNINGAVAEAGVYRGEFARYINMLFPERQLYLFDSFEGFSEESFDLSKDNYDQVKNWGGYKADTSVDTVLRRLPYPQRAIIRKGYVPQTLSGVDDSFCFVNLDMDLYMPTYEALLFFWQRMSPGGYIFVHDVNNWDGCGKAVHDFCEEIDTGYICLNDRITAAILKPFRGTIDGVTGK